MRALFLVAAVAAERLITSNALVPCMANSSVTANKFHVVFTPDNRTITYDVSMDIGVHGYVYANLTLYAYGFKALTERIDPCSANNQDLHQLCPLVGSEVDIISTSQLEESVVRDIPGVAYSVPDIDVFAVIKVYARETNELLACMRAELTNRKTVEQTAVKWVTALITGVGLLCGAIFYIFGYLWTTQRIVATTLMMFSYFQTMATYNLLAVDHTPPMVNAWSENVAWSLGLVYVKFMQKIFRWYVQATGGEPSTYHLYPTVATLVQRLRRRTIEAVHPRVADWLSFAQLRGTQNPLVEYGIEPLLQKRERSALAKETFASSSRLLKVFRGIKRMGFTMGIEQTSIVLTAFTIFVFVCFCALVVFCILFAILSLFRISKKGPEWLEKHPKTARFAPNLALVLRGTMLCLVFMAFPAVLTFAFWEFVQRDSAAVIVVACVMLVLVSTLVVKVVVLVVMLAQRSIASHGTAAYLLYSDNKTSTQYSFLYAPYHASNYWFILVQVAYYAIRSAFVAFSQSSGQAQSLALMIFEFIMLVLLCWRKPYMDKATNVIGIALQVILFLNALMFSLFSNVFGQPLRVGCVLGVVYFVLNAAFSTILLLYLLIYNIIHFFRKDPDAHVPPAADDRMSFIGAGYQAPPSNTELLALGNAAFTGHELWKHNSMEWFNATDSPMPKEPPLPQALNADSSASSFERHSLSAQNSPGPFNLPKEPEQELYDPEEIESRPRKKNRWPFRG